MSSDPLRAIGQVFTKEPLGGWAFSGTCFRFRRDSAVLTAAHCCPQSATEIRLTFPRTPTDRVEVAEVRVHPTADLAVLHLGHDVPPHPEPYPDNAFWDEVSNLGIGEEFMTYGYPTDAPSFDSPLPEPTPRLFKGYYQRFFEHSWSRNRPYLAGEISSPAPAGLSGAPLFRPGAPQMVTGLITANLDSYSVTDSYEDIREDGSHYRLESRRVITYGVALILAGVSDWLDEVIPRRASSS